MIHQVITNVVCWSVIALLKEFVFLTVAVSVLAVFGALTVYQRCCVHREDKEAASVSFSSIWVQYEDKELVSEIDSISH